MKRADDVSCLREQGAWRYANTYADGQVGQPIVILGPKNMIGWKCFGPTPATDDINTFRPLNLVTAIWMWRDFQPA